MHCNACKNQGSGICENCTDLKYHEFIEEYNCEYFYKGYCSKYKDSCFKQCQCVGETEMIGVKENE